MHHPGVLRAALALALIALAAPDADAKGLTLTGTVSLRGAPPPAIEHRVLVDRHVCGRAGEVRRDAVELGAAGGVEGAVVFVSKRIGGKLPKPTKKRRPMLIDQIGCEFVPRVAAVRAGTAIRFANSDEVLHTAHVRSPRGKTMANLVMPIPGQEAHAFRAPKPRDDPYLRFSVGCEAGHTWMRADILSFAHDLFTISGPDGAFRIEGLPPGRYEVRAWHPLLGEAKGQLELKQSAGGLDLVYEGQHERADQGQPGGAGGAAVRQP